MSAIAAATARADGLRRRAGPRRVPDPRARPMHGRPLVYLDSAASAQKPRRGDRRARARATRSDYANIHRGVYDLSQRATDAARRGAAQGAAASSDAADWREIVFTRNATEGDQSRRAELPAAAARAGRRDPVTEMEHHANIVPWQLVRGRRREGRGRADHRRWRADCSRSRERIGPRTRMIGVVWVSNVLGTVNPVARDRRAGAARRRAGADRRRPGGAAHRRSTSQALDCDFLVFSGHKMYGPVRHRRAVGQGRAPGGDAALPGRRRHDRARSASSGTTFNEIPFKFEAGTPDIAGIVALGAAIDYIEELGLDGIAAHESRADGLRRRGRCSQVPGLRLIGDRASEVQRADLRHGGRASAGHRHAARSRRYRRPHRPSLRHAAARAAAASARAREPRSAFTTPATTSTRWSTSLRRVADDVRIGERDVGRDDQGDRAGAARFSRPTSTRPTRPRLAEVRRWASGSSTRCGPSSTPRSRSTSTSWASSTRSTSRTTTRSRSR